MVSMAVVVATAAPAAASAGGDPLVLDVDITPACGKPAPGRVSIYHPTGLSTQVEWRVRLGGETKTGTVSMDRSVARAEFTLPVGTGEVLVDARRPGGAFGPVWREDVPPTCDPVNVVSVGDSVVWNQGVEPDKKFPRLTAKLLGEQTGRGYTHRDYSISGAVLDAPELPKGNDDRRCLDEAYLQDPDQDGEMELGEVTAQMPDVFCQLERAGAAGQDIDLVILNGCINDMDPLLGIPFGITPGTEDVPNAVRRECGGVGAAATNPAEDVPYFSGAKVGYGGRGIKAAIEKAHSLPGHPKVLVADFYYALSRASGKPPTSYCTDRGFTAAVAQECVQRIGRAPLRYEQFTRYSAAEYRRAVDEANAASGTPYAVAGDGLFTVDNAAFASNPQVWQFPTEDPISVLRRHACPEFSPTPPQCLTAALAHPNTAGSRRYAESFLLNPRLRGWFGLPGDDVPLTTTRDGDTLHLTAKPGSTFRWFFGDGTMRVTDEPTTSHVYTDAGPHIPRVIVDDRTLQEGNPTVIG